MNRRVVVLGAGAAGVSAANRLARHADAGAGLDVVLIDRSADHVFMPGYLAVMLDAAEPSTYRRPLSALTHPRVGVIMGEVSGLDPDGSTVTGAFGDLRYDELVVAVGVEVGWPDGAPAGDLAPWTLAGALRGRDAVSRLRPEHRVVVGPTGPAYRCPPAVFDFAVRISRVTGARVQIVHPWPRPLAPFGDAPAAAFTAMLDEAGVVFHGQFTPAEISAGSLTSAGGATVQFDVAFLVPPHRAPATVASLAPAGGSGWPAVTYPTLTHPAYPNIAIIGDLAAPSLKVGMAGTLAVFQAAHVADRIAERAGGPPAPARPQMSAICFVDTGRTGSFLHCDFTGPAEGTGPADCLLMPWLPYFRRAKQVFADEWFTTMLSGQIV